MKFICIDYKTGTNPLNVNIFLEEDVLLRLVSEDCLWRCVSTTTSFALFPSLWHSRF